MGGRILKLFRITVEIAVVVVFAFLLKQNWALRHVSTMGAPVSFEAGQTLPDLPVIAANGRKGVLNGRSDRHLLLIGDPRCPSCEAILERMPADRSMVLSIANHEITRSSFSSKYFGPIYSLAGPSRDPRLNRVPQLLLVDSRRIVRTCADPADCR